MTSLCARAHAPQLGCAGCEISQQHTAVVSGDAHKHERCQVAAKPYTASCQSGHTASYARSAPSATAAHAHADAAQASV
jgi:hypothetical protein